MSRDEARKLLDLHAFTCDAETLDAVLTVTEGWVTGLYLALLAGEGRPKDEWLPRVRGDRREIAAYLVAEVLEQQPLEVQRFLVHTSILESLCAPLCDAVTGSGDAGEVLARLARENLFVAALDDRDHWYRYHHLFGELLRAELGRRAPLRVPDLHRAAAAWHHENGDPEQAVLHWLAAADIAAAAEPAFVACFDYVNHGQVETARRMLDAFTEEQLLSNVTLSMAAGWLFGTVIGDSRRGDFWRRAACAANVDDGPLPGAGAAPGAPTRQRSERSSPPTASRACVKTPSSPSGSRGAPVFKRVPRPRGCSASRVISAAGTDGPSSCSTPLSERSGTATAKPMRWRSCR